MNAAQLAEVLDPNHEVAGWWWRDCPVCDGEDEHREWCANKPAVQWDYIGPPYLHTAREHAWRGEDFLVSNGCRVVQSLGMTEVFDPYFERVTFKQNHSAAIADAVETIAGGGSSGTVHQTS